MPIALLLSALPAFAQDKPNREREALRRAQQQVSKLQQDNATLQTDKAALEQKLKAAEAELAKIKGQVAGNLKRKTAALEVAEKDNADLKSKLAATESGWQETKQKCQAEVTALHSQIKELETNLARTRQEGEQTAQRLDTSLRGQTDRAVNCETKNQELYQVTMDLVARYKENRGAWEKFLLAEPFTQLKSVQVENLLQEMREKAADARVAPRADNAPIKSHP